MVEILSRDCKRTERECVRRRQIKKKVHRTDKGYLRMTNMIMISRVSLRDLMALIPKSVRHAILEERRTVILFPEGTRTEYGAKTECRATLSIIQKNNDFLDIYPVDR